MTIKQDHVIKEEEFKERIRTRLMFEVSLSTEDGTTSSWTLLVVTLLALTRSRGATAWGTHFCLKADFEQSGWQSSMIFDMGGGGCTLSEEDPQSHWEMREGKLIVLKFWTVLLLQKG
jgi:hypothetical protein